MNIFVGYDTTEAVSYHSFCQSVIETSSIPVSFTPLVYKSFPYKSRLDGSKEFTNLRYYVPHLMNYKGRAIYCDSDMLFLTDVNCLASLFDERYAVQVVKHDYQTKFPVKFSGNPNLDYPRKNWSSLVLWNCEHEDNRKLTPDFIAECESSYLHRFQWLGDEKIGELDKKWNWLVGEYEEEQTEPFLIHFTIGLPYYEQAPISKYNSIWYETVRGAGL